jgi:hypothetical protein
LSSLGRRLFRLYGPLDPRFAKQWKPGEIELVKEFLLPSPAVARRRARAAKSKSQ